MLPPHFRLLPGHVAAATVVFPTLAPSLAFAALPFATHLAWRPILTQLYIKSSHSLHRPGNFIIIMYPVFWDPGIVEYMKTNVF